jgi:1,4-dihydroxy-2-naphthoyl-CoA hydrolase
LAAAEIFPTPGQIPAIALPLVHCSADFLAPLVCGDPLAIQLEPRRLDSGRFEVHYNFRSGDRATAKALTRHLAIETASRQRCPLPAGVQRWLEASSLGQGIQPL